jgi:AcrR family transcriptional regulator
MQPRPTQPIFPRLSSGPRKMEPEAVARHQRGRLQGAMVEAVARNGYNDTTLRELVTLAGVSKTTFYENFADKQACFLSTFDAIIEEVSRRVDAEFARPGTLRERLRAGLDAFLRIAADEDAAAALVTVESLTLGAAAVPHRESAGAHFEEMIREGFRDADPADPVSDLTVRGIVAGIRNSVYRHLRSGRIEELPATAEDLVDWVLSYEGPPGDAARAAAEASRESRPPLPDSIPESGDERRGRIMRAAAELTVQDGYDCLTIPAISAAAGVSNQTFYEYFTGKEEALLAGFAVLAEATLRRVSAAFMAEASQPRAIGAGLRALLDQIVEDELFARLAFFELPMAGQAALDQADAVLGGFSSFLEPGAGDWERGTDLPEVVKEGLVGGGWAIIQHEITAGRLSRLPELAPPIAEFLAAPLDPA